MLVMLSTIWSILYRTPLTIIQLDNLLWVPFLGTSIKISIASLKVFTINSNVDGALVVSQQALC